MPLTAAGIPYVASSDALVDFPAHSLALADAIRAVFGTVLEKTTPTTGLSATTEGAAQTVIGPTAAVTFNGTTPVVIEFWAPSWQTTGTTDAQTAVLLEDSTVIAGKFIQAHGDGLSNVAQTALYGRLRRTPAAGSHTYTLKWFVAASTSRVEGGAGGAGNFPPMILSVRRET